MNAIFKGLGLLIGLFILFGFLGSIFDSNDATISVPTPETKTAYTRDGINFISEERMDENIKYAYAKSGDYKKVEVPLNTIIVGASIVPSDSSQHTEKAKTIDKTVPSQQTAPPHQPSPSKTTQTSSTLAKEAYSAPVSAPQENVANNKANGVYTTYTSTSANSYTPPSQRVSSESDNEWAARGSGKIGRIGSTAYQQQSNTFTGTSIASNTATVSTTDNYIGNSNTKVYHNPSCSWVHLISPEHIVSISSPEEARSYGYRPCKKCNPP